MRSTHQTDLCFSICRFSQVVFITRGQPHAQSLFLFPIVFGINLIHFFDEKKDGAAGNSIVFFFLVLRPLSGHLTEAKRRIGSCFEECTFFGNGKCELSAIQGEKLRCNYLARKSAQFFAKNKVQIFAKESAKLIANFITTWVTSPPSLSLSMCISLSLTERTSRTL